MSFAVRLFYDSMSSYGSSSKMGEKVFEDKQGKYIYKHVTKQVPCGCHPETCNHFDGIKTIYPKEKVYLEKAT